MTLNKYNYKKRNLFSGPHLAGSLLILIGVFAIISPYILDSGSTVTKSIIVGVIAIVIGLLIVSSFTGILFDFKEYRCKEYTSIGGLKVGDWEPIPPLASIKIQKKEYQFRSTSNGITPTFVRDVEEFKVHLIDPSNRPFLSIVLHSESRVKEVSKLLAKNLNVSLYSSIDD